MEKYEVIDHFDVWGNKMEGFTVNNSTKIAIIELPENASDKEIISKLKEIEYLKKHVKINQFDISGDEYSIMIDRKKDSYPLCTLNRLEELSWLLRIKTS